MPLGFLVVLLSTLSTISLGCTEESCLLATHPALKKDEQTLCEETQLPGPVEPREKVEGDSAMDRWLSSWRSQLAYNAFKMYTILFINTAIGGMLGDIIGTMLTAFWPPKFSKEQAIMQAMMEWTQNYVQMALEQEIKENIAGKMCSLKMQVDEVKKCTSTLVQKIKEMLEASWWRKPDFPQKTLSECLGILQNGAKATAREVATQIATSSHRGVLGGEFAAISWSLMGIWRQIYYLRRLEEGHYDEFPDFAGLEVQARSFLNSSEWGTSEEVRKEMVNQSIALLGTAKDIRKAWEEWRFEKVKVKAWTEIYDDPNKKQGFIQLTDQLTDTHQIFQTEKKQILNEPPWPEELEQQKWQDVVFENYKKMLYIKEFIPTMKTMPYLKQLIPGQEKDRPEPAPFDEFIQLRFSAFLAGAGKPHMNKAALREGKWMLAPDKIPDNGPIEKMSALQDDVLRQLTFISHVGHKVVLGTRMADPQPEKYLPKKTCGLDLGYRDDWMVRITFLNAEEEAEVAELKAKNRDETAIFSTGVGLCGLYTFDRPTHEAKDFGGTGDAFEVQFRWDPDESGNHK